jgi:hypothetical protein
MGDMRIKKSVLFVSMLLVLSILITACEQNNGGMGRAKWLRPDKVLCGNPDMESIDDEGFVYGTDLDERWVDEPMVQSQPNWAGELRAGSYISIVCRMNDDINAKYKLEKKLIKAYCFEWNENYEWNVKDYIFTYSPIYYYHDVPDGSGNTDSWYGYDFQMDIPVEIEPGKYTLALVREDDVVEIMLDFCVPEPDDPRLHEDIPTVTEKPVIYLYPEAETDVNVRLDYDGDLTCTYPEYGSGWNVTAFPGGKIYDTVTERYYDYLFWEGTRSFDSYEFRNYACVAREDTAEFLESYLEASGLNDSEIDDFISYWLPRLQASPYNLISFPNEEYNEWAKLDVSPKPDTVIRVYMVFTPVAEPVDVPASDALTMPSGTERRGFTVVEWGGSVLYNQ